MLGVDAGPRDIDGIDECLTDGCTLCVGPALGFCLGYTGSIDAEGRVLSSILGVLLGVVAGLNDIDGIDEALTDGPILEVGVDDCLLDGSLLVVGTLLGFFVGECENVGNILTFTDGMID